MQKRGPRRTQEQECTRTQQGEDHIGNCLLAREFQPVPRMDERNRNSNQAF